VNASDGTLSSNAILIISLNKINKMPEVENAIFSIDENSPNGTIIGTINASDPEGGALTFSFLTGNELSAFSFSGKNIIISKTEHIDFEQHPVFNITFNVSDGISNVQASVTINLNDVFENTENFILSFSVPGMVGDAQIDNVNHTIFASVKDVDLSTMQATFTVSPNAVSNPVIGTTFNFTTPQTITVTAQSGDIQEWVITVTKLVGNNEFKNLNVKLYPNPTSDYLIVSGLEKGSKLKIVSLTGQIHFQSASASDVELLDLSNLKPGNYLVVIDSKVKPIIQKLIKR